MVFAKEGRVRVKVDHTVVAEWGREVSGGGRFATNLRGIMEFLRRGAQILRESVVFFSEEG